MPDTALREFMALLWTRRFGTFWFASLLSNIGTWAQQVAQPWRRDPDEHRARVPFGWLDLRPLRRRLRQHTAGKEAL
jgi:hypothetical protein